MFILVWTDRINGKFIDHWQAYEGQEAAQKDYEALIGFEDTWSASLCAPIKSTDYAAP